MEYSINIEEKGKTKDFNLTDYEKEEGGGFYYKKNIDFNNTHYDLIGVGCRYKLVLSIYSVGIYYQNQEKVIDNNLQEILNNNSKKILLLKFYREVDILNMVSALNGAFKKRMTDENNDNEKIYKNLLYFEWILKKFIPEGLKQHDELIFEWENNKLNIYIGNNEKNIKKSYFYEKIKDNLTPSNNFHKKIGEVEDENICRILFDCYLDDQSVAYSIKYSINKFMLTNKNNYHNE